jgi:hypothetical protein
MLDSYSYAARKLETKLVTSAESDSACRDSSPAAPRTLPQRRIVSEAQEPDPVLEGDAGSRSELHGLL